MHPYSTLYLALAATGYVRSPHVVELAWQVFGRVTLIPLTRDHV